MLILLICIIIFMSSIFMEVHWSNCEWVEIPCGLLIIISGVVGVVATLILTTNVIFLKHDTINTQNQYQSLVYRLQQVNSMDSKTKNDLLKEVVEWNVKYDTYAYAQNNIWIKDFYPKTKWEDTKHIDIENIVF